MNYYKVDIPLKPLLRSKNGTITAPQKQPISPCLITFCSLIPSGNHYFDR